MDSKAAQIALKLEFLGNRLFPQPVQPCRNYRRINKSLAAEGFVSQFSRRLSSPLQIRISLDFSSLFAILTSLITVTNSAG
jgi:hypothetical protein